MKAYFLFFYFLFFSLTSNSQQVNKLLLNSGSVSFVSDAPLEKIKASSNKLRGLLLLTDRTFAFSIDVNSFNGFNGSIQQEHFNENYMESEKFPRASFTGKIVEDVDIKKDGIYELRAKGKLTIHGIEKIRTIKIIIETKNGRIGVNSKFLVLLEEHGITIPSIVNQKIAEEIQVEVNAQFNSYE